MSKRGETSNKTFQYFMVGGMGLLTAAGAKATVQGMFSSVMWGRGQCLLFAREAKMDLGGMDGIGGGELPRRWNDH